MTIRILLSTTSYQDTPGSHQDLLESQGWDVVLERGHKLMVGPAMIEIVESASAAGDSEGYFEADERSETNA